MHYRVTVLDHGARRHLRLQAAHPDDAAEQARGMGLTVLAVRPGNPLRLAWPGRRQRFPLTLFTRELLALLGSGLALVEALQALVEKETRGETRRVLERVLAHLYEGESFSAAIAHHADAFPPLYVATVRAAERTSDLPQALARYVAYEEQVEAIRKKALAAAVYPTLLLTIGTLVAVYLLGWVVPRFAAIYADEMHTLPWGSRLLMHWGSFVQAHAGLVGLMTALLAVLGVYALRQPAVRAALVRLLWRVPAVGERLRIFQLTRFYRTVGMLLMGGIPIVTALSMAEGLLTPELRLRLASAQRAIREGRLVSQAMDAAGLTTPVALRMLRVGEKSGRMGAMMEAIAAFHDEELARAVDWLTRLIEPALMVLIGLTIGAIVVLLYMPIFDLAGMVQ